jgi:hypothetical protein
VETETAPGATVTDAEIEHLRGLVAADETAFLSDLERLVNTDCGSYTPAGVDEIGRFVAAFMAESGGRVELRPDPTGRYGQTVIGTWDGDRGTPGGPPRGRSRSAPTGSPTGPASPT